MKVVAKVVLALALAGLLPGLAQAEKADRSRPIQIEADSVSMDDLSKSSVYQGNVIFSQGTLNITADRVVVHQDDKGVSTGEATGQPVHFRQKMEGGDEFLEARAQRIDYDARTETMKLTGDAWISRGNDELRGGVIIYDIRTERYQAQGASVDGGEGRVRAVIRPRNQPDEAPAAPTPVQP